MSVNPENFKEKNVKENKEKNVKYLPFSIDESSIDTSFTEDDSSLYARINLKKIKENLSFKRKLSFKIPDIHTLNLDTRNTSSQTISDGKEEQLVKVISQFRIEKEKFQELLQQEKDKNAQIEKYLDVLKEKNRELSSFGQELEKKFENSINSENIHVKQAQELSNKCVQYSNQLISVNLRINELNQELNTARNALAEYKELLELFKVEKGGLKEMILGEREERDTEIKMLNERIQNMIQLYQMESSFTPQLPLEDKVLIGKLEGKIEYLKEEAEKERIQSKCHLSVSESLKQELENLVLFALIY